MRYAELPGTSIEVSKIGMGCYAASGVYGDFEKGSFTKLLRDGYEQGVTLFDTAAQYGESEQILGEAVRPFRHDVVISSKVGLTSEGRRDCSAEHVVQSCEASLAKLNTDYIDLY